MQEPNAPTAIMATRTVISTPMIMNRSSLRAPPPLPMDSRTMIPVTAIVTDGRSITTIARMRAFRSMVPPQDRKKHY